MMIARRRQRGIASLACAARWPRASVESFSSCLICPMDAFAPVLRVGVGMTIGLA